MLIDRADLEDDADRSDLKAPHGKLALFVKDESQATLQLSCRPVLGLLEQRPKPSDRKRFFGVRVNNHVAVRAQHDEIKN